MWQRGEELTMERPQLPFLPVTELAELIAKHEISPVEVVEAYLERIERLDARLNAFLTVCRDEALQAAHAAERALARGEYRGPLHGVPFAVKDQLSTKGIRTTAGTPIFEQFVPDADATVVAKLEQAGAVLLGKLNMTEFGTTGFSHQFSTPRNPWDLERYTGGSSSGSGAATAGFLCATSLGEDTGGSVRFPAAWCGLVGLRPSWGRVSRHGLMPGVWSMDTIGPLSRTVADCALTLEAIAGHDPKDPYTWNVPVPRYAQRLDGNIKGLKVGVVREQLHSDLVEPEIREAVLRAVGVLKELGASVAEVSIPLSVHASTISGGLRVEAPLRYRELIRTRLREIGHDNRIGYLTGALLPAQAYYKAQQLRSLLRQEVLEALERVDVLVQPTAGKAAQTIEPDPVVDSQEKANRLSWLLTTIYSLANTPALNIPCGFLASGEPGGQELPIGLQIAGRPFAEETVLKVAYAYEQATPWHTRRPPL
jgi:aspartyl-tRNA(Asn)/glutamyl-tRNA(Gln) amidotransferase subunit A